MGKTSLVLGISGLALSWIPYLGCVGWIAGILAIVFGALGLARANRSEATNRGSTIAGLTTGIAALAVGLAVAATLGSFGGPDGSESEAAEEERSTTGESEPEAAPGEGGSEAAEEPAGIGDGQWEVGTEIEPGTYVTWVGEDDFGCYAARISGFSGDLDEIIANTNLSGGARGRITVADDDTGVKFSGGCEWLPAGDGNLADPGDDVGPGIWEVRTEIQPGTYTTQAEEEGALGGCYVARLAGFSLDSDEILDSGLGSASLGTLRHCRGTAGC